MISFNKKTIPAARILNQLPDVFWSWLGSFLGIFSVYFLHQKWASPNDLVMVIGSFGATAVLLYCAYESPLAQPRNLIGGHLLSALVGVTCWHLFYADPSLAGALAVSVSVVVMSFTRTLHPPGGATALIAILGSDRVHALGYGYVFIPVLSGAFVMLAVAVLVNKIAPGRKYPLSWF